MYIKKLRLSKHLSQEELAEKCKVSLRTIQRVESGHRVGYATLRSLSEFFDHDVDLLERELYAVNKDSDEFMELPLWARFILGRGHGSMNRDESLKIEIFFIFTGTALVIGWFLTNNSIMLYGSWSQLFGASIMSLYRAVGDRFDVWRAIESSQAGGIWGLFKKKT